MPLKASHRVEKHISSELRDHILKAKHASLANAIYHFQDSLLTIGEDYSYPGGPAWTETRCMCVAGPLPQHIRILISKFQPQRYSWLRGPCTNHAKTVSQDITAIKTVLLSYQDALNNSSVDQAVKLYTRDGICMPQHAPSFIGSENVRKAYEGFFALIKFDVKFEIHEIVPMAPDWAFARTNSAGTTDVKGKGVGNEANHELFIFQKADGEWKIARYCFSTTNPPPK